MLWGEIIKKTHLNPPCIGRTYGYNKSHLYLVAFIIL